jgi:hypothetical protein
LSGTRTLTEVESRRKEIEVRLSKAGALTVDIDNGIKQSYWLRDMTDDAANVIFKPVGGTDDLVMPGHRWNLVRTRAATMEQLWGWQDSSLAPALVFAADYQVTSGRPLKIYKDGTDPADDGGRIHLEGAVEEGTTVPAAGDTIVTLPAGYRPEHTIAFAVLAEPASTTNVDVVIVEITAAGLVILRSLLLWTTAIDVPIDLSGIEFFAAN